MPHSNPENVTGPSEYMQTTHLEAESIGPGPLDSNTIRASLVMLLAWAVSSGWIQLTPEEIQSLAVGLVGLMPVVIILLRLFKNQGPIRIGK